MRMRTMMVGFVDAGAPKIRTRNANTIKNGRIIRYVCIENPNQSEKKQLRVTQPWNRPRRELPKSPSDIPLPGMCYETK